MFIKKLFSSYLVVYLNEIITCNVRMMIIWLMLEIIFVIKFLFRSFFWGSLYIILLVNWLQVNLFFPYFCKRTSWIKIKRGVRGKLVRTYSFEIHMSRSGTSRSFERRANNVVHHSPFTHGDEINRRLVERGART